MDSTQVQLTVGLPLYRAGAIAWLALESLCRQVGVEFYWELLVAEEQSAPRLAWSGLAPYVERLRRVNCIDVRYVPLSEWIPLAKKWRLLGQRAVPSSRVFVLQAADCYSPPHRLERTMELFRSEGADWVQSHTHVLYNLSDGKHVLYRRPTDRMPVGAQMALRTDLARQLPESNQTAGIDHWFFRSCEANVKAKEGRAMRIVWNETDDWRYGLNVNGLNNISERSKLFALKFPGCLEDPCKELSEYIPGDVLARLEGCRPALKGWRRRAWSASP